MSTIEIRKYQPKDQKSVQALVDKILSKEFREESEAFPTEDLQDIGTSYGKLGEAFFVAIDQGRVVGTVGVKQEDARTALLRRLFVESKHRGQKLGAHLIDRAIDFSRDVGYAELIFKTTSTMEDAVQLGERKGFVPKARLDLGPIKLLKFALYLKKNDQKMKKKS